MSGGHASTGPSSTLHTKLASASACSSENAALARGVVLSGWETNCGASGVCVSTVQSCAAPVLSLPARSVAATTK
jgi:hypothetical protein